MRRRCLLVLCASWIALVGCRSESGAEPADPVDAAVPIRVSIRGKLVLPGVSELAGFPVTLVGPATAAAATDASGTYAFDDLPPGSYVVSIMAPSTLEGSGVAAVTVDEGLANAADVKLTPLGDIRGRVTLGGPTGNAGIAVVIAGTGSSGFTDDSGTYVIRNVPTGPHDIVASRSGWSSGVAKAIDVSYAKVATAPDIVLSKPTVDAGTLSGSVAISGESSHAGVTVVAAGPTTTAATISDAAGAWSIAALPPGKYAITAQAPSTLEASRTLEGTVETSKSTTLESLAFTPVGTLRGRVTLAGRATGNSGIAVWVADAPVAFTNDVGDWEIRGARTGLSTIRASKAGYAPGAVTGPKLAWRATATADSMNLAVDASTLCRITGVAKFPGRATHDGIDVSISGSSTTTSTASDGSYSLDVTGAGIRLLSFKSKDGRYEARVPNVMLMGGGAGFVVSGSTLLPIPAAKLVRGRWIGEGQAFGRVPTGELAVAVSGTKGHIDLVSPTGATKNLFAANLSWDRPILSPDGGSIVFGTALDSGYLATNVYSLATSAAEVLGEGIWYPMRPEFVGGGKQIAFMARDATSPLSLRVRTMATGTTTNVAAVAYSSSYAPTFSDGGTWVACPSNSGRLVVASTDGTSSEDRWIAYRYGWTFDHRVIASTTFWPMNLVVSTPGGSVADRVLFTDGVKGFELSPDRRWAAVHRTDGEWLVSLATADAPVQITTTSADVVAFTPDSTKLVVAIPWGWLTSNVQLVTLASPSPPSTLGDVPTSQHMLFFGGGLVFTRDAGALVTLLPLAGGTAIPLSSTARASMSRDLYPSPDGTRLAWIEGDGTVRVATAAGVVSSIGTKAKESLRWCPDSSRLVTITCAPDCVTVALDPSGTTAPIPIAWGDAIPTLWLGPSEALVSPWGRDGDYRVIPAPGPMFVSSFP